MKKSNKFAFNLHVIAFIFQVALMGANLYIGNYPWVLYCMFFALHSLCWAIYYSPVRFSIKVYLNE